MYIDQDRAACHTAIMSPELIGIISVGVGLAALFAGLFAWLRQDMKELGNRLDKRITEQGKEIEGLKKEVEGLKIEVASLKATVETYFRVRVDPPRTAAVAEDPGDYGAD